MNEINTIVRGIIWQQGVSATVYNKIVNDRKNIKSREN